MKQYDVLIVGSVLFGAVFAFEAKNLIEAMDMGKRMPSVKHTRMIMAGRLESSSNWNPAP